MPRILKIPEPPEPDPVKPIPRTPVTGNFCPVPLGDWLELYQKARVPHVLAARTTSLHRADWVRFDVPGDHHERLKKALSQVKDNLKPRHIVRFDFCSPLEVKFRLGQRNPEWRQDLTRLHLDDPRAFDILFEHPREEIPVWQRPWMDATVVDGYPVEYRAYVLDGEVQGISSYYSQRPLPRYEHHLKTVREYTEMLIAHAKPPFLLNQSSFMLKFQEEHDRAGVHFTADFLVTRESGEVLFIEGGPPHELGAHPCCFRPGGVEGIALTNRNEENQG